MSEKGAYFIGLDGKSVRRFASNGDTVVLDDGKTFADDGQHDNRMFAVDPEENRFMTRDDEGFWVFDAPGSPTINYKDLIDE